MSRPLAAAIDRLFDDLDAIADAHDDLTDTDVREAIDEVLAHAFVWGQPLPAWPRTFRMLSRAGDQRVSRAVQRFLAQVTASDELRAVPCGAPRHALLHAAAPRASGRAVAEFIGDGARPRPLEALSLDLLEPGDYDA